MNRLARHIFGGLSIGAALVALAGCGKSSTETPQQGASSQTVVEFWHYFSQDSEKALKELIKEFESANPGIKIKPVFQSNPRELRQKLDGSLAASPSNNPAMST